MNGAAHSNNNSPGTHLFLIVFFSRNIDVTYTNIILYCIQYKILARKNSAETWNHNNKQAIEWKDQSAPCPSEPMTQLEHFHSRTHGHTHARTRGLRCATRVTMTTAHTFTASRSLPPTPPLLRANFTWDPAYQHNSAITESPVPLLRTKSTADLTIELIVNSW